MSLGRTSVVPDPSVPYPLNEPRERLEDDDVLLLLFLSIVDDDDDEPKVSLLCSSAKSWIAESGESYKTPPSTSFSLKKGDGVSVDDSLPVLVEDAVMKGGCCCCCWEW